MSFVLQPRASLFQTPADIGVVPGIAGARTPSVATGTTAAADVIAYNDRLMQAWFDSCRAKNGGPNIARLYGTGQIIDTAKGWGCDDTKNDLADGMTLVLDGTLTLRLDVAVAAYFAGVVRLCGNNITLVIAPGANITIDRPFQPIAIDANLDTLRTAQGQPNGITIGGLARYNPSGGKTIAANYVSNVRLINHGRLTIRNMSCCIVPTYVASNLTTGEGGGRIVMLDFDATGLLVHQCGVAGDHSSYEGRRGGDDFSFFYHTASSPWAQAGRQPGRGSLRNYDFRFGRGKAWGVGGYGDVEIGSGFSEGCWAGDGGLFMGPYSNNQPTWASNSQIVKAHGKIVKSPGNIFMPNTAGTPFPQYATPAIGYSAFYIDESQSGTYAPARVTVENTTVINPASTAIKLDTATMVSARIRAEAGSTSILYMSLVAASWTSNTVTFTTIGAHGLAVGAVFTVAGATPSAYNGQYTAIAGTTGSTLVATLNLATAPAAVTGPYAGAPAGLPIGAITANVARTTAQFPAALLRNARTCDVELTLKPGPNGEQFPNAFQVTGNATAALDLRGGDQNFGSTQLLVDASVPAGTITLRTPAALPFASLTSTLVSTLATGTQIFVTDGRESGQAAGAGSGVFAFKRGSDGTMRSVGGGALAS